MGLAWQPKPCGEQLDTAKLTQGAVLFATANDLLDRLVLLFEKFADKSRWARAGKITQHPTIVHPVYLNL